MDILAMFLQKAQSWQDPISHRYGFRCETQNAFVFFSSGSCNEIAICIMKLEITVKSHVACGFAQCFELFAARPQFSLLPALLYQIICSVCL